MELNHHEGFADFCRLDKLSGGPDSHMTTIVHMAKGTLDPAWLAGLYAAVYNVPMAWKLYDRFPTRGHAEFVHPWLEDNWKSIVMRRERKRPVGSPTKLSECIQSYARWIDTPRTEGSYEELWESVDRVKYFGRYAKMKILECLYRMGETAYPQPDARAKGGWSPREGLALLYPQQETLLKYGGDRPDVLRVVEALAVDANRNLKLTPYEFQVLICDYKQVAVTERQYPGRSVDSELSYHTKVGFEDLTMFAARENLFPQWALGEKRGWPGVREELGTFFVKTGTMWSDSLFDYLASKDDVYHPVRKAL